MVQPSSAQASSFGDRRAPQVGSRNRLPSSTVSDVSVVTSEGTLHRLANAIASDLWSRLPISRLADETGHRGIKHVVSFANSSHSQIVAWHNELRDWVTTILHAGIEIRGDTTVSREFTEQIIREIEKASLPGKLLGLPPQSFVDYQFADLSPDQAFERATKELQELCLNLVTELFALLDRLHHHQLVGKIEDGSSTSRFTFFRRVAILEIRNQNTYERSRGSTEGGLFERASRIVDTIESADVQIEYRTAKHVHHVHHPSLMPPDQTKHPLPQKYQDLINATPDWLRPSIQVLEGDLIREQQIEWETGREDRLDEKIVHTRKIPERSYAIDPAVVFGGYVLAGWGERAVKTETERRWSEEAAVVRKQQATKARLFHWLSLAVAALALGFTILTPWATPFTLMVAIVVGLAATFLSGVFHHLQSSSRGEDSPLPVVSGTALFGGIVFAAQAFAFSILHLSLPALGLALLCGLVAAIASILKS